MTIAEAKQKLVELARSEIGYHEGPNNWTKYADDPMITQLYGWCPQNQPWCCTFVNFCYMAAFGYDLGSRLTYGGTSACSSSAQLFIQEEAFKKFPEICDQAFFYSGGGINHTGIVVAVNGSEFTTVEGNYSDKVSEVKHNVGRTDVAGFGRPNWQIIGGEEKQEEKPEEKPEQKEEHGLRLPMIQIGSVGDAVSLAQAALNLRGYNCGRVDGEFGPKTQSKTYQLQKDFGLVQDGIVGTKTWGKLLGRS